jgi:hypothetical protein
MAPMRQLAEQDVIFAPSGAAASMMPRTSPVWAFEREVPG